MDSASRVLKVVELVEAKLPYSWPLNDLAAKISVSKWHLQREFKTHTGLSIGHYARMRRLGMAANELANTDKRIIDVALDFNFESQEAFARAFKRHYGLSPKHLKLRPQWAKNLLIRPITREYLDYYQYFIAHPPKTVSFPETYFYGLYDHFSPIRNNRPEFLAQLQALWDKFLASIPHDDLGEWQEYYSVETVERGGPQMQQFTMMAARTRSFDQSLESKCYMPAHQRLCFSMPNREAVDYFLEYLWAVFIPETQKYIMRLPTLWQMDLDGNLCGLFALERADELSVPDAVTSISPQLVQKPATQLMVEGYDISPDLRERGLRMKAALDKWSNDYNRNADIIIGNLSGKGFEINHEFRCHFVPNPPLTAPNSVVAGNEYLQVKLTGDIAQLIEAIEYVQYCYLEVSPYYSCVGCEWFTDIKKAHDSYSMTALFPVKKR